MLSLNRFALRGVHRFLAWSTGFLLVNLIASQFWFAIMLHTKITPSFEAQLSDELQIARVNAVNDTEMEHWIKAEAVRQTFPRAINSWFGVQASCDILVTDSRTSWVNRKLTHSKLESIEQPFRCSLDVATQAPYFSILLLLFWTFNPLVNWLNKRGLLKILGSSREPLRESEHRSLKAPLVGALPTVDSVTPSPLATVLSADQIEMVEEAIRCRQIKKSDSVWIAKLMPAYAFEDVLSLLAGPVWLRFDPENRTLWCRGLSVTISSTPFLYYYIYSKRRALGNGWVLNPSSTRADLTLGSELLQQAYSLKVHKKAIDELTQKGARARVLDQNRNKVKERLYEALGPELAEHFLFEAARDDKSGRYKYRLRLTDQQIEV